MRKILGCIELSGPNRDSVLIRNISPDGLDQNAILQTVADFFSQNTNQKIIAVVPDSSRQHSFSGSVLKACYEVLGSRLKRVLIALGTHKPMSMQKILTFYPDIPQRLFLNHNWKNNLASLGTIKKDEVLEVCGGPWASDFPVEINSELLNGYDMILSIGQIVPHEIAGMANHSKNILIGTGGSGAIGVSHFLGAVCNMEKIMGRVDTPVRRLFNHAMKNFASSLPISYIHTVCTVEKNGQPRLQGLFAGDEYSVFTQAAELSARMNITSVGASVRLVMARTDEKTLWLANKAIYRSRMMIDDGGTLVVMAPQLDRCADDFSLEGLILKIGYRGTDVILQNVNRGPFTSVDLAAFAHLIHGSSEGRFSIVYAVKPQIASLVEAVGYQTMDIQEAQHQFGTMQTEGFQKDVTGHEFYHLPFPASGLWTSHGRES